VTRPDADADAAAIAQPAVRQKTLTNRSKPNMSTPEKTGKNVSQPANCREEF
jgi:hypothetical protein